MNWTDTSLVHPSGNKQKLDIYFQPALTWIPAGTQGVALLFIEDFTDSPETDKQDFRELVKSLLRWTWRAAGRGIETITPEILEEIYENFISNPFRYTQLKTFLGKHFDFHIQEYGANTEMAGTIFPMFPELSLVLAEKPGQGFSIDAEKLGQTGIDQVKNSFNALKSQFDHSVLNDPGAEPAPASPSIAETSTISEFIFNDYARLLTQSILQRAIDQLEDHPDTTFTMETLITALDKTNPYRDIAGMVSRFLMHGLHLPALSYAAGGLATAQALYKATHQQFAFSDALVTKAAVPASAGPPKVEAAPAVNEYRVTLKDPQKTAHLVFPGKDGSQIPQIVYTLKNDSDSNNLFLALARQMNKISASDTGLFPTPNLKLIPWYRMEPLHFAFRKQVEWAMRDNTKQYLLQLPGSLNTHLKLKDPNPTVSIKIWPNGNPNPMVMVDTADMLEQAVDGAKKVISLSKNTIVKSYQTSPDGAWMYVEWEVETNKFFGWVKTTAFYLQNSKFTWATRIDLPIQRITKAEDGQYLSQTYAFTGTSEVEKDLLEAVWAFLNTSTETDPVNLHLLYAAESGSVASKVAVLPGAPLDMLLIKANLSNDTTVSPTTSFSANFTEEQNFLKLIWEGSTVVSGAYYLYFPEMTADVEDTLFHGKDSATLQLIIEFTNTNDPIHDFNNAVIFTEHYDLDTHLILAESTEKVPVLAIPPGFLGFQIDDLSEPDANPDSAQDEIKILYQLLGYKVVANTRFSGSNEGLPIGPTAPNPNTSDWLYEKLIPTYAVMAGGTPLLNSPPDPYAGVGKDSGTAAEKADLKLQLWWQDLYGNKSPKQYDKIFKVRYTDPLIGINQWPSVSESFEFVRDGAKVMLHIFLSFDASPYALSSHSAASNPENSQKKRVKGDRETYQKIYYQIVQNDIRFSIGTSLDTSWKFTAVDKAKLTKFIHDSYLYLDDLMNQRQGSAPDAFSQKIDAGGLSVNKQFIFEVTAGMDVSRDIAFLHDDLKTNGTIRPEYITVLTSRASLTPKLSQAKVTAGSDETLNLREFATNFETAFPGLHLGVSEDSNKKDQPADTRRPLYAVQLGMNGINVDIRESVQPFYYAIPPLANTLLSGKISVNNYAGWKAANVENLTAYNPESEEKQFNGIDVNVLARSFLVAVEDFLDPAGLVAGHRLSSTEVERILNSKSRLASAVSRQVLPVFADQSSTVIQQEQAKEAIRQELLLDLVKGYDIETIVQYRVDLKINSNLQVDWVPGFEPRLSGKAKVVNVWRGEGPNSMAKVVDPSELDFSLSSGKIRLTQATGPAGDPTFTFLFDSKTPEKYANLHFELEFITSELEYDIKKLAKITDYEASNWLNFILPEKLTQSMGIAPVPIPLRYYPTPPSLISQQAEADPTSLTQLQDVRQWKYTIIYEHPDVAQDSIDCILDINLVEKSALTSRNLSFTDLFQALVNFGEVYPLLGNDLSLLKASDLFTDDTRQKAAKAAIAAFEALVADIATQWSNWTTKISTPSVVDRGLHYEVSEEMLTEPAEGPATKEALVTVIQNLPSKIGGPNPLPTLELPGYKEMKAVKYDDTEKVYTFTYIQDPDDLTFFGDSSIPDRKFMIENLDVIEHQNAWAKIWLSRNKNLVHGKTTNNAFVFRTPAVRFTNMVTPFITNDEPWDIATLSPTPRQTLLTHLNALIQTLFPKPDGINYEVRLSCRYAFSLALGKGLNVDLEPSLPLLMGLRLNPKENITLDGVSQNLLDAYPGMLEKEIKLWFINHDPVREKASIIFSVNLFSKLDENSTTSLPMLRIKHLELQLKDISDLLSTPKHPDRFKLA